MTKRKKFRPARFLPGRGVPWHGGMKPLPRPTKHKKTAPSVTSTESGKVEQSLTDAVSASNINENGGFVK